MSGVDVAALRALHGKTTPGVWKLWGMTVMADQDGTSNFDTAASVAQTYFRDEHDKPRTWDAEFTARMHRELPDLLDEVERLRATVVRVKALADGWMAEAIGALDSHPDGNCGACTLGNVATLIRAALEGPA